MDWQSQLSGEEMPPRWMWHLNEELNEWFEEVREKRQERFGRTDDDELKDAPDMIHNELAKERRR